MSRSWFATADFLSSCPFLSEEVCLLLLNELGRPACSDDQTDNSLVDIFLPSPEEMLGVPSGGGGSRLQLTMDYNSISTCVKISNSSGLLSCVIAVYVERSMKSAVIWGKVSCRIECMECHLHWKWNGTRLPKLTRGADICISYPSYKIVVACTKCMLNSSQVCFVSFWILFPLSI